MEIEVSSSEAAAGGLFSDSSKSDMILFFSFLSNIGVFSDEPAFGLDICLVFGLCPLLFFLPDGDLRLRELLDGLDGVLAFSFDFPCICC